jgi:hypothetical protein
MLTLTENRPTGACPQMDLVTLEAEKTVDRFYKQADRIIK